MLHKYFCVCCNMTFNVHSNHDLCLAHRFTDSDNFFYSLIYKPDTQHSTNYLLPFLHCRLGFWGDKHLLLIFTHLTDDHPQHFQLQIFVINTIEKKLVEAETFNIVLIYCDVMVDNSQYRAVHLSHASLTVLVLLAHLQ